MDTTRRTRYLVKGSGPQSLVTCKRICVSQLAFVKGSKKMIARGGEGS